MGLSLTKIHIFLILSSQDELKVKMDCLISLLQNQQEQVLKEKAQEVIETVFEMCSSGMLEAFHLTGYFYKEFVASEELSKVKECAKNLAGSVVDKIFEGRNDIEGSFFGGFTLEKSKNLKWILTPRIVFAKVVNTLQISHELRAFDQIDNKHKERAEWIVKHLQRKKEEREIKEKEAIEQKLHLMDGQDMDSQKSDESEQE